MSRSILARALAVCIALLCLALAYGCGPACTTLSIDQRDAVGTFVSLGTDVENPAFEVAPGLIRAKNGEKVVWVIRNPSSQDIRVRLTVVREGSSTSNVKSQIFSDPGGTVTIPGNCGIGALSARLAQALVHPDSCTARYLNYDLGVITETDSITIDSPYDPELVIEGKP